MATALDPFYYFWPSDNVAPDATVTTTGTEDTSYPLENAVDVTFKNLANPSKLTGTSGRWVFDFGGAQRGDYIVIQHNLDENLTFDVQAHTADVWTAPTWTTSRTAPAKFANGHTRKVGVDARLLSGYTVSGLRYISLNITGTNSVPVGIKVWVFSTVRQFSRDFRWSRQDEQTAIGIRMKTDAGVPWHYDLNSAPRVLRGSVLYTDDDAEDLREWFRACAGGYGLTGIVPDPTDDEDVWIGFLTEGSFAITPPSLVVDKHTTTRQYVDANEATFALEEATSGDPEWY